jgi:hypothetical protein
MDSPMTHYDDQYYIVYKKRTPLNYSLIQTKDSKNRRYKFSKQSLVDGPLTFNYSDKQGDLNSTPDQAVLFDGTAILIHHKYLTHLESFLPSYAQFFPSLLIDEQGIQNDAYSVLNIYQALDCIDPDNSDINDEDEDGYYDVNKFSLRESVLNVITENERQIIKLTKVSMPYTLFHESLVNVFKDKKMEGIRFFKVSEFEEGDQF